MPVSVTLDPVPPEKKSAKIVAPTPPGTPYKIGFSRDVLQLSNSADTARLLQWQDTPQGGKIAAISITSSQATGIRLGILVYQLPAEAAVRFYAQGAETAYETSGKEVMETIKRNLDAGDRSADALTYWAPSVKGEEATIEIELPAGTSPDTVKISIPRISHFFSSPLAAPAVQGVAVAADSGDSTSCRLDATCYGDWSVESKAIARMVFTEDGSSYLCTGTLLNDVAGSFTPYFLSANHCISRQTAASSLQTYWFYQSSACDNDTLNPGYKTLFGGATLLYASSATDTSFMRLNAAPPAGVSYVGWNSDAPARGTPVTGIHHPHGELQKISFGSIDSFQNCTNSDSGSFMCTRTTQSLGEYIDITFTRGITEGGSSGSGLFIAGTSGHKLIGQLYGGNSSCSYPEGSNIYGRFDVAYNAALYQWLSGGSTGPITPLYFPHVETNLPWQTEIAVINTSDQPVTGTLKAFSDEGALIETKPAPLSAHGRKQIAVSDEFTNHTNVGYIIYEANSGAVRGYTKLYQTGNYRMAIPAVREPNTSDIIHIPHIASDAQWHTEVSLLNTTSGPKELTITFNDGQSRNILLAKNEHRVFDIAQDFFNNQPQPSIQSAVITNASGIIGMEIFRNTFGGNKMDGILLTGNPSSTIYYPHIADNGWWTGIVAYNTSDWVCSATITPYTAQGTELRSISLPSLQGKGRYSGTTTALGLPAGAAWFKLFSTSTTGATCPLTGFELFGTASGNQLAAYGGGGTGAAAGVFPKIEKNGGWTGIVLVNTETAAASVVLTAYKDDGTPVATQVFTVGGHAKVVDVAENIFSQSIGNATYIAYASDRNVVGFQINGTSDDMMLDGLPGLAD